MQDIIIPVLQWSEQRNAFVTTFYNRTQKEWVEPPYCGEQEFKRRLQERFPYVYEKLQADGQDLSGWIFRNFLDLIMNVE